MQYDDVMTMPLAVHTDSTVFNMYDVAYVTASYVAYVPAMRLRTLCRHHVPVVTSYETIVTYVLPVSCLYA